MKPEVVHLCLLVCHILFVDAVWTDAVNQRALIFDQINEVFPAKGING